MSKSITASMAVLGSLRGLKWGWMDGTGWVGAEAAGSVVVPKQKLYVAVVVVVVMLEPLGRNTWSTTVAAMKHTCSKNLST